MPRNEVEKRREFLINELIRYGYPIEKGEASSHLTLFDLENLTITVKCQFGREMSFEEGD
ncbi:Fur-regulated basic protein FbpA [Bacillus vallismortis]|uniref:Fur-regulated basic protein FbpA n=1 Tax=Bacillus vallismortis TaxID=72361 RepID=UPI002DB60AE5|nr:Fur-regulated basic protein FbpA [Bacillus vallismortis]MEC1652026.1 Fur-regulated basic protein FbpA [Bacillus vallismortis]